MPELDPLRLPLEGRRLIEASAGTGKTYAIGSLLIRALIGHGDGIGPLRLDRVLVVTFTNAATQELRDRIRSRLRAARDAFRAGAADDPFVTALIDETEDVERAARLLDAALGQLDEAAVFTIHGFCQRVLRESAFESGVVFEQAFVLDDGEYVRRAVADHWRRAVYALDADAAAVVREEIEAPAALLARVRPHLGREDLLVRGGDARGLTALVDAAREVLGRLKRVWRDTDVVGALQAASVSRAVKDGPLGPPQLAAVDAWLRSDEALLSMHEGDRRRSARRVLRHYTREHVAGKRSATARKKGIEVDLDGLFDVVDEALECLEAIPATFVAEAIDAVRAGVRAEKRADRMIAPDDVLRQMAEALRGDAGAAFAAQVRTRYPLAFIDEFQDTDPLQYEIFDALYAPGAAPEGALVLIGDPKQAIYGFRGADIHAYLQARDALALHGGPQARVHMGVNWRSTPEMLEAVGALYGRAADPFGTPEIDFVDVRARDGAPEQAFRRHGAPAPTLTFLRVPADEDAKAVRSGGAAREVLAAACGDALRALLDEGTSLDGAALARRDVAVLVNDRNEAETIRAAFARRGIGSVWQSRDAVFGTDEAQDLRLLLAAAVDPRDERAVRAAVASRTLDLAVGELDAQLNDEDAWQVHLDRFAAYHDLWRERGVMVMLSTLLADYAVPDRLLEALDGARRLTDLRHLGELLQTRAREFGSMHRLLRWYARQVDDPQSDETAQLRLESDGDLVRIATVHGSKGLEYPVVLLPFGIRLRGEGDALHHESVDGRPRAVLDLRPDDAARAAADRERLAEHLRLLYVALTRSRFACLVGVADAASRGRGPSDLHRTALGHLLCGPQDRPVSEAGLDAALADVAARSPWIDVRTCEPSRGAGAEPAAPSRERAVRRDFTGHIERDWRLTSYSALVAGHDGAQALRPGAQDEIHEDAAGAAPPGSPEAEIASIAARFPRGARPGTCLHDLLETWPAEKSAVVDHVRDGLARWGLGAGADEGSDPRAVADWLTRVRATPLGIGTDLAGVHRSLVEMEFVLPVAGLDGARLQRVLLDAGYVAEPLARDAVRGMLRGFVDLVLEHDDRFWVVDYKSNWLGPDAGAYDDAAMTAAIRAHRYDLQFLLYSVALRRLLRARGRDADTHFGGVLYLFLRGMDGRGTHGVHRHRPDPAVLDAVDACIAGRAP